MVCLEIDSILSNLSYVDLTFYGFWKRRDMPFSFVPSLTSQSKYSLLRNLEKAGVCDRWLCHPKDITLKGKEWLFLYIEQFIKTILSFKSLIEKTFRGQRKDCTLFLPRGWHSHRLEIGVKGILLHPSIARNVFIPYFPRPCRRVPLITKWSYFREAMPSKRCYSHFLRSKRCYEVRAVYDSGKYKDTPIFPCF